MQQQHMPVSCYFGNRACYRILVAGLMIVSLAGAMNCSKSPDNKLVLLLAALVGLQNSTGAGSPRYKVFVTAGIHAPSMGGIAGPTLYVRRPRTGHRTVAPTGHCWSMEPTG